MATVSPPAAVPAGERGATSIADRVVAKIAAQAAREALRRESPRARTDAHATVTVHRREERQSFGEARVRIAVELGYPSDIGAQSRVVRRHVTERVQELANMAVPEVAVEVERLHSPQLDRTDRGRVR
ncbi:Asp23/Gls24 family envelope stress response protein [Streptomyces sioyaensis]|uniref:Asp23/Gls24 family envelope stress response protein n=1 Tax=Streptomyces sioyaensis TaxID=67364 RepID=UPI001F1B6BDB|nr:Asp23/Gls24 family envelope stress response protein [Streptomyces sioyaensis]MCF3176657.1 Asp23/Gls24 family envelope stress response protein [Streptomyces sioyaensis]